MKIAQHYCILGLLCFVIACRDVNTSSRIQSDEVESAEKDDKAKNSEKDDKAKNSEETSKQGLDKGLKLIKQDAMNEELTHLASKEFNGRLAGSDENNAAAEWIIKQLKSLDIKPAGSKGYEQTFQVPSGPTAGKSTQNIVALLPGQDEKLKQEYIIIGAHMDHVGTRSVGHGCGQGSSGSICYGADDNGSGTITLLNVAKALAETRKSLKRSVVLIWFSAEELGLFGSKYYINKPLVPLKGTVFMINLDMVGYLSQNNNKLLALGGETSSIGSKLIKDIGAKYSTTISSTRQAGGNSDHAPFMNRGIPGVFFSTGVAVNPNYHKTSDTADRIDYEGMETIGKITYEVALGVANQPSLSLGLSLTRTPFVTDEEIEHAKGCHHPINAENAQEFVFE